MNIITGMHRSGTSLVSQLLYKLGGDFGPDNELLGSNKWNAKGYFENKHIVDINNKLIVGEQASIEDWIAANQKRAFWKRLRWSVNKLRYFRLPSTQMILARANRKKDIFSYLTGRFPALMAKDTRFSLTVAAWLKFGDINRILYVFRNPKEVALSLRRREGLPLFLGYRQWLIHVTRFFEIVNENQVHTLYFNNFFHCELQLPEIKRVYRFLDLPWEEEHAKMLLSRTIDKTIRHHEEKNDYLPENVKQWFYRLRRIHERYSADSKYSTRF